MYDKTSLVRALIPKSYHFDGYNEINVPNTRDKPFFGENFIQFGTDYHLSIQSVGSKEITLKFRDFCYSEISFPSYTLSLEAFVCKLQTAVYNNCDVISFEIPVKYGNRSHCTYCNKKHNECKEFFTNRPKKVYAAVSFDFDEMQEALAMYFKIKPQKTLKGDITMKKNNKFLGMNFEFGMSKDPNIASTLLGVAVRNTDTGNWYVFDPKSNTRKNLNKIKMGNFPLMLIPTKQYSVGRLYKEGGKYYYVRSVNPNGTVTFISATDGVITEKLPEETLIPGLNFYTEVIAFDAKTLMNANSNENVGGNILAAMAMMQWAKGSAAEFSLDELSDDSFNGMGSLVPMLMMSGGGNFGGNNMFTNPDGSVNFLNLMALGSLDGEGSDMTQMLVLSQLMGNGNSPLSGIMPTSTTSAVTDTEKKVACEKCGNTYPDGTNFCPKCGSKTQPIATSCKKCGATLMEGAAFCHKCGCKVAADICPACGQQVEADANFCHKCGVNIKAPVAEVPADATSVAPVNI